MTPQAVDGLTGGMSDRQDALNLYWQLAGRFEPRRLSRPPPAPSHRPPSNPSIPFPSPPFPSPSRLPPHPLTMLRSTLRSVNSPALGRRAASSIWANVQAGPADPILGPSLRPLARGAPVHMRAPHALLPLLLAPSPRAPY